jgi:hypothetical protein
VVRALGKQRGGSGRPVRSINKEVAGDARGESSQPATPTMEGGWAGNNNPERRERMNVTRRPAVSVAACVLGAVAALLLALAVSRTTVADEPVPNDEGFIPREEFLQFTCDVAKIGAFDPALDPPPGKSHDHIFYGNTSVNPRSTPVSLAKHDKRKDTTCFAGATWARSHASYWVPQLYEGGKAMRPVEGRAYYMDLGNSDNLRRQFPPQLTMIGSADNGYLRWRCDGSGSQRLVKIPYGCSTELRAIVFFPQCWNPDKGWGPNSMTHRFGSCRANEVRLADFRLAADFKPHDGRLDKPLMASAGDGHLEPAISFFHADRMEGNGAPPNRFTRLMEDCVLGMPRNGEQPPLKCFPHP